MEVEFFKLHRKPELLEATAKLLNTEWPRSLAARMQSVQDSTDALPCSIVACVGGKVIGHVRLLEVLGKKGSVIVESLLVDPSMRGRGLGRRLMENAENLGRHLGYESVHLSTHDQHAFYQHIGYQEASPVTGTRKCLIKLEKQASDEFIRLVADDGSSSTASQSFSHCSAKTGSLVETHSISSLLTPPPPPPLPPLQPSASMFTEQEKSKWYKKSIDKNIL